MSQNLTGTERDALTAAAKRPDGRIHPLPKNVDADLLVGGLVVRELIEQVPDERPGFDPFLRITYKGLKALHADSNESASADEPSDKTARETFIAGQYEFDDLLERLRDACGVHFNVDPERVDWADVGTLYMRLASLRTLCDHVFKEGEHAEPAAGHDGHAFNRDGRKVAVRVPTD